MEVKMKEKRRFDAGYIIIIFIAVIGGVLGKEFVNTSYEKVIMAVNKEAHIISCMKSGGERTYCECTFNALIEKYSFKGYQAMAHILKEKGLESQEMAEYKPVLLKEIPTKCR